MLSVVITPAGGPEDLAFLFARLVPAAVDGLVREVIYAGAADATVEEICEATGARIAEGLGAALAQAKGPWVLVAPATFRPPEDWQDRAAAHLAHRTGALRIKGVRTGGWFARNPSAELRPLARR
ncbi:cell wall biosynthesis glycosyltransferase [Phenylobacterium sp.]|jgi:hypothetical protein|uniref:cell wall biosynthesis glycosyltransferase n=1 Tax=Phenylobacterium sp. TaxID=1871053 RepID=UPI002E33707F|nr:cell wall biosynthesis glycosyltransferase [Phenylobacterium sp.]HEX2558868.1 cell wall biosynthesis glycosyltransferase [Phenylobacterium sp.]